MRELFRIFINRMTSSKVQDLAMERLAWYSGILEDVGYSLVLGSFPILVERPKALLFVDFGREVLVVIVRGVEFVAVSVKTV
jgi:hypothetical protein